MNEGTIAALDDDEFADELREHMMPHADGARWDLFVSDQNVRRTLTALEEMLLKVEMQLETHGDENPQWFGRANNFKRLVTMRLKHVNRVIYHLDGSHAERERKLRAFAHELCVALDASDQAERLDDIFFPFAFDKDSRLSAGEWLDRRIEKRAAEQGNPVVSIERALDELAVAA